MEATSDDPAVAPRPRRIDRGLGLFILGAVVLILAGLIAIPLSSRRTPTLAPESTPEGTVQRFYQAVAREDYAAAYDYVSPETRRKLSLETFREQAEHTLDQVQVRTRQARIHDSTATVEVALTSYSSGDLFDSGEYTYERDITLERVGDTWKIKDGPFYLPVD